jgi:hypothetical protein
MSYLSGVAEAVICLCLVGDLRDGQAHQRASYLLLRFDLIALLWMRICLHSMGFKVKHHATRSINLSTVFY